MRKITTLPYDINPDRLVERQMTEKYGKCPFCGKGYSNRFTHKWHGKHDEHDDFKYGYSETYRSRWTLKAFRFWEKDHDWKVYKFSCNCGAEWLTEPFRVDNHEEAVDNLYIE